MKLQRRADVFQVPNFRKCRTLAVFWTHSTETKNYHHETVYFLFISNTLFFMELHLEYQFIAGKGQKNIKNSRQHCIAKIRAGQTNFGFGSVSASVPADVFQFNFCS